MADASEVLDRRENSGLANDEGQEAPPNKLKSENLKLKMFSIGQTSLRRRV